MPLLVESTSLTEERAPAILCDPHHQPRQPPEWPPEDNGEARLMQQERELAQLQREAEATNRLILEVRREAEEATIVAVATAFIATALTQQLEEAPRQEEAKQAQIKEEAAMASTLAAETTKMAAAHAMADARQQEHRMAVQAAMLLKAEKDKDLARQQAAKVAAATVAHKEQVLATATKENVRLIAELAHTRTLVL